MSKRRKLFLTTITLLVIAIIYTLLVKYYDVGHIGPEGSAVGFSGINDVVHKMLPYNETWYKLTKYLGISKELFNDIITINNDEYDKLLLLSDGVTDSVNDATIETIASVNNDEDILGTLIVHANKNRSKYDDVTGCCYFKKRG